MKAVAEEQGICSNDALMFTLHASMHTGSTRAAWWTVGQHLFCMSDGGYTGFGAGRDGAWAFSSGRSVVFKRGLHLYGLAQGQKYCCRISEAFIASWNLRDTQNRDIGR